MSELKPLPCPFCGGAPRTVARPDNIDGTRFFYALACYCGGYSACAHKMAVEPTPEQAERTAIEAWNRRAQPAQVGQVLMDDRLLAMWEGTDGERALRPTLGKNKILSFARATEAAVMAKRVPMTDEEIFNAYCASDSNINTNTTNLFLFARAIERHHGIVSEKGGA